MSGVYTLNPGVVVYCDFDSEYGSVFTYISPSTKSITDISSLYNVHSLVVLRHLRENRKQYTAKVEQISAFDGVPLSVKFNSNVGYNGPINTQMGPFIHLGIVPAASITARVTQQGWSIQGTDYTFTNCDVNPSSYFVFLLNEANASYITTSTGDVLIEPVGSAWVTQAINANVDIPSNFFVKDYELHFGGCGARLYGSYMYTGVGQIKGVALGLKSNLPTRLG